MGIVALQPWLSLQAEFAYVGRGTSLDLFGGSLLVDNHRYLEVPVMARLSYSNSLSGIPIHLYGLAGPAVLFELSADRTEGDMPTEDLGDFSEDFVFDAVLAVGVEFDIQRSFAVAIEGRYNRGLTAVLENFDRKHNGLFLNLTFAYAHNRDSDRDSIINTADQCWKRAERGANRNYDGCFSDSELQQPDAVAVPDSDSDGDGVFDEDDQCPDSKRPREGHINEDGCREYQYVRRDQATINTVVPIEFDKGNTSVEPRHLAALNELALYLDEHPDIRLLIRGHADADGQRIEYESRKRAENVRVYLIARDVDAGRLEIAAMGASLPLAEGTREAQKNRNRRVDFRIIAE